VYLGVLAYPSRRLGAITTPPGCFCSSLDCERADLRDIRDHLCADRTRDSDLRSWNMTTTETSDGNAKPFLSARTLRRHSGTLAHPRGMLGLGCMASLMNVRASKRAVRFIRGRGGVLCVWTNESGLLRHATKEPTHLAFRRFSAPGFRAIGFGSMGHAGGEGGATY
jgi:hypothetical protein